MFDLRAPEWAYGRPDAGSGADMDMNAESLPDANESPVGTTGNEGASGGPTPRLTEAAAEKPEDSVERERDAVGDAPDTGGLTPPDQAQ